MVFAVLITVTFALAFNSVQSNTISIAMHGSFGIERYVTGLVLTVLTLVVIWGGIQRIAKINEVVVPVMAVLYILLAVYCDSRAHRLFSARDGNDSEECIRHRAGRRRFDRHGMIMGVKRGLFSNEAGEGSTPNAAATAAVSHPVKQGLIQTLGVYTDTLLICTATAFIILCSGVAGTGLTGIELTQAALASEVGGAASAFVAVAIVLFGFTSIIANYYYGESNLGFIKKKRSLTIVLRLLSSGMVMAGSLASLDLVWGLADITMAMMTLCNIIAILLLGGYAACCLRIIRRNAAGA